MSRLPFPPAEEGRELHRRVLARDPAAPEEVYRRYAEPLSDFLQARHRWADEHACTSAMIDAVVDYLRRPERFDPAKLDLGAFLRMAAQRDLCNLDRPEAKHRDRRESESRVEDARVGGNHFRDDPLAMLVRREEQASARRAVEAVREQCSGPEREVLGLMLEGERSSVQFAAAIGAEQLPVEDQCREVKRHKDRIKKRLERGGGSDGESVRRDGEADPS